MPTDREIVQVIAEKVMGWELVVATFSEGITATSYGGKLQWWSDKPDQWAGFNPLESWADAGMVLDKLPKLGLRWEARLTYRGTTIVKVFPKDRNGVLFGVEDQSCPRAISLAAYEWSMAQQQAPVSGTEPGKKEPKNAATEKA